MQCLGYDMDIPASEEIVGAHVSLIYQKKRQNKYQKLKAEGREIQIRGKTHIINGD